MSLAELQGRIGPLTHGQSPDAYETESVPSPHRAFASYTLMVSPRHGLCKIVAWGNLLPVNDYGFQLRGEFGDLEAALTARYGPGEKLDTLNPASVWRDPKDWMMALLKEDRYLITAWDLGADIDFIMLRALAVSRSKGLVILAYQFRCFTQMLADDEPEQSGL